MPLVWKPTASGKLFTRAIDWSLSLDDEQFELIALGQKLTGLATLLENLSVKPGAFWATVKVTGANGQLLVLDGIPNDEAENLKMNRPGF